MTERHPQARQKFPHAEGLLHVVVGAEVERLDLLDLPVARSADQDRAFEKGPGFLESDFPVHVGQPEIQNDRVGRAAGDGFQAVARGVGALDCVAGGVQRRTQKAVDLRFIIDHEDSWPKSRHGGSSDAIGGGPCSG